MRVLGSASVTWKGDTRMDLLDVKGTILTLALVECFKLLSQTESGTSGAIRRVLREAGFHKIPSNDCIQDFVIPEVCRSKFEGFYLIP